MKSECSSGGCSSPLNKENMFRIIPEKSSKKGNSTSSTTVDSLKCEFAECDIDNVDLIKCNVCEKWVCENCNDVPVAKLKTIINKCQTVFFICKACESSHATENRDGATFSSCEKEEYLQQDTMTGNTNLPKSLQSMLDNKVSQIESKLDELIDCKLGEKMDAISTLNEKLKEQSQFLATVTPEFMRKY